MEHIARKAAIGAAALVSAKYLDAKLDISYDWNLISSVILTQIKYLPWLTLDSNADFAEQREPLRRIDAISFTFWRTLLGVLPKPYFSFTKARSGRIKKRSSKFSAMGTTSFPWELNHEV